MAASTLLLAVALLLINQATAASLDSDFNAAVDEHEDTVGSLEDAAQHFFHYEAGKEESEPLTLVDVYNVVLSLQTKQCRRCVEDNSAAMMKQLGVKLEDYLHLEIKDSRIPVTERAAARRMTGGITNECVMCVEEFFTTYNAL